VSCARAKQEIAQVSLQNSAYVTLLSQRRVELRSDSKKSAAADSEDEESLPIAEGRRVSVASDSTFCIFQEWARTSFFRSELLDRSEKPTFTVYESTPQPELEWTLLPVVHPDGSILALIASLNPMAWSHLYKIFLPSNGAWSMEKVFGRLRSMPMGQELFSA
jgi:hypothetical protein